MKKYKILTAVILLILGSSVYAASVNAVPTGWRLENYPGDRVYVYFTGSPCTSGLLSFDTNATNEDKNRFWSLVMAAKLSNKPIIVYYDNSTSNCYITSFALKEE